MAEFPLIVEQALAEVKQTTVKMVSDRILQQLQLQKGILHSLQSLMLFLRAAAFPYGDCVGAPLILQLHN